VVAIGGLVRGPCPRAGRHLYLAELVRTFPDTHFWALGQASAMVVNGLGQLGLLDRISTDGSWWIHHARTEQFAVVQNGLLNSVRLTHTGASSFFTLVELMAANCGACCPPTRACGSFRPQPMSRLTCAIPTSVSSCAGAWSLPNSSCSRTYLPRDRGTAPHRPGRV